MEGIIVMGGTMGKKPKTHRVATSREQSSNSFSGEMVGKCGRGLHDRNEQPIIGSDTMWENVRLQTLLDLPGSQLAVLFSARRLVLRDREEAEMDGSMVSSKILTYERMHREYQNRFLAQGLAMGSDRYESHVYFKAFVHLLETGLLQPASVSCWGILDGVIFAHIPTKLT